MDTTQLTAFCEYMIGDRVVGGDADDPAGTPHSPELRAFILARIGADTPTMGYQVASQVWRDRGGYERQAKALAALLREVADGLDPPPEAL